MGEEEGGAQSNTTGFEDVQKSMKKRVKGDVRV